MGGVILTSLAIACVAALLAVVGWRRILFGPFTIRPRRMTVAQLRLNVVAGENTRRVNSILRHFVTGFNTMLTARSERHWRTAAESVEPLFRPFSEEGVAMGYTPRRMMRFDARDFESRLVRSRPEFRYLYYVGLGFWSGMLNHRVARLSGIADRLDPLHRFLVFDGYGFKVAFFDHPRNPDALDRLTRLSGYARNAAFQGVGRALYFRFMDDVPGMIEGTRRLGAFAADAAAGIGLAAVFVNPDRIEIARQLGAQLTSEWHSHFQLGMCFALKARSINDLDAFETFLAAMGADVREAACAAVRECDRIELLVRDELRRRDTERQPIGHDDGYRVWRERVAAWLDEHIEYPLTGVKTARTSAAPSGAIVAAPASMHRSTSERGK
jgi:hypothetical protein